MTARDTLRRVLGAALVPALLAGCGLPLAPGVQDPPPAVPAGQQPRGDIQVLPPGPRPEAGPVEVVRDFFGAQSSPTDGHAIAREFLTPDLRRRWRDGPQVTVYEGVLRVAAQRPGSDVYVVTGRRVGRIRADGTYRGDPGPLTVRVHAVRQPGGAWRLDQVPDGLLLSTADRDRSFLARDVYYLAPPVDGDDARHLVPDRIFFPVTADPADALVRRLLDGPSSALGDSVQTAFPPGTRLRRPVRTDADGLVTVDLTGDVATAPRAQREQLSAQLVWTLRGVGPQFSRLRLRGGGRPVPVSVGGTDETQSRSDWGSYDPDGLSPRVEPLYIENRRLRSLGDPLPDSPVTDDAGTLPVDAVASAASDGRLAVLTRVGREWQLRTGPPAGPFGAPVFRGPDVSDPSWGGGQRGVWFLAAGRLMLAPPGGRPYGVPVDDPGLRGPFHGLRVSRDGARIALVLGQGRDRQLLVGRIHRVGDRLRVGGLAAVAPEVSDVGDVGWDSPTGLVVLGRVSGLSAPVPVRVAVDGSSVAPLVRVGLEATRPVSLAAAPGRPLVVGALVGDRPYLFRDNSRVYAKDEPGEQPSYPG